jgi:hypothetical protein
MKKILITAANVFIGFHQPARYPIINHKIMGAKCPAANSCLSNAAT